MRYMIIVKGTPEDEKTPPSSAMIAEMGQFNQEMMDAGVWETGEGLMPSKKGARVRFSGRGKTEVIDGPFSEAKEIIGGFWIIQVKSFAEAVDWAQRIPCDRGEVDVRKVGEAEDYVMDEVSKPYLEKERAMREAAEAKRKQP